MKNGNKGFTLIELLVVVLIIGILAAIALPQYQRAAAKSKYATLYDRTNAIAQAEELYYLTNGTYTTDLNKLDISIPEQKDYSFYVLWGGNQSDTLEIWGTFNNTGLIIA
jgi:prepilin-type N-terminal cleavage/methylation domain-containing protein